MKSLRPALAVRCACIALLLGLFAGGPAEAQRVRIDRLADFSFGLLTTTTSDIRQSGNVCISTTGLGGYNVRASGSGSGGLFTLAGVGAPLAYEVQWNGTVGQQSGTALIPGQTLGGLTTAALGLNLNCLLSNTASLIIVLRAAELSKATAGAYSGTLTLVIAPE